MSTIRDSEEDGYEIVDGDGSQWRLGVLPPCSSDDVAKPLPPTRFEGVVHLVTFKAALSSYIVGSTAVG
jgi:hypothetical protein